MKYIILQIDGHGRKFPFIFPTILEHSYMEMVATDAMCKATGFERGAFVVTSAGFVKFCHGGVFTFGKSELLKLKANMGDAEIIEKGEDY